MNVKTYVLMVTLLLPVALLIGCDDYQIVENSDAAIAQKVKSGAYELIKKEDLAQLKHDADLGKAVGRYQIYRNGFRTWRLDSSTGNTCILLTTEADWKTPEAMASACNSAN
jgi:hypothetical protein